MNANQRERWGRRRFLLAGSLLFCRGRAKATVDPATIKALTFDVFGTVVDWRSSMIREGARFGTAKKIHVDWARFADAWRAGYGPAMDRVRRGELPWTNLDRLHRMILNRLLVEFKIEGLSEDDKEELNRAWHHLAPWPDVVSGLQRLRRRFIVATLSNGNISLLVDLARYMNAAWDCILSSELAKHYKPDKEVYLTAADLLGLRPEQVMMVAAHKGDLRAASGVGFKTAFVPRPLEQGPGGKVDASPEPWIDVTAGDFNELAHKLGA